GREVQHFGVEVDPGQVDGGVVAAGGEPGGVLARVAQVPDVELGLVVPDIGEQNGRTRQPLHDLHGQRGVHVGLGGADQGLFGAVPVVGVVEEGLGHVHRAPV